MRISQQLLCSRAKRRLKFVEYLDLSNLDIVAIECLSHCSCMQSLILRNNHIDVVRNLNFCYQLWNIDIGNNRVSNLDGLSRFVALGSVNLANNDLQWSELMKIQHIHILDLHLHGNAKLENYPYYRIHVIDSLPAAWMLDGRSITSVERIQVEKFFQESALSKHPVRHKLTKDQFVTTLMKKIQVNGTYSDRTTHLMVRFPRVECLNTDTDVRRIKYLAYNLQLNLFLEERYNVWLNDERLPSNFLESLVDCRTTDCERSNVLLLLLIASLEFSLPTLIMKDTLEETKLDKLGNVSTIHLFLLSREHRCQICSLLMSAVKVDKDSKKDGGLHDRLYLCLYYTVMDLMKRMHANPQHSPKHTPNQVYRQYRSLLAAEVVQLFCIVPAFFEYVLKDSGVIQLISVASGEPDMAEKVSALMSRIIDSGGDTRRIMEEATELLVASIYNNTRNVIGQKISHKSSSSFVLSIRKALPRRPQSSTVYSSNLLSVGRSNPVPRPVTGLSPRKLVATKAPMLGEKILLGPQHLGFIIALPEHDLALIQMENIPVPNGSMITKLKHHDDLYSYVDMKTMVWYGDSNYWKPQGTVGDRITIQSIDEKSDAPPNPPSSPDHAANPRSSHDDLNINSPKDKNIPVPPSISEIIQEKLKANLDRKSVQSPPVKSREPIHSQPALLKDYTTDDRDLVAPEHVESALYDCIKFAVATVKSNCDVNTIQKNNEGSGIKVSEDINPPSAMEKVLSQTVAEVCPECTSSQEPFHFHSNDEHQNSHYYFNDVISNGEVSPSRRSPQLRAQSARSVTSNKSSTSVKSHLTLDLDLRPDSVCATDYQFERTETWKKSVRQQYTLSSRVASPHSRASSSPVKRRTINRDQSGSPVNIQMGNSWLAGGRDIHYITKATNQMKLNHTPGWMDGLQRRPLSSSRPSTTWNYKRIRNIKSAHPRLEKASSNTDTHLVPSPASSQQSICQYSGADLSYLYQARQHNFTTQRVITPPSYQGQARPPSPLDMTVK